MENLEHVELCKCESVEEFTINKILELCPKIIYLDITSTPVCNYAGLDELKNTHPNLLIRRNVH